MLSRIYYECEPMVAYAVFLLEAKTKMKLRIDYATDKGKQWDRVAGFLTAIAINSLLLISNQKSPFYFENSSSAVDIDLLPWIINGLFLLVFLLILPQFFLGYLTALAIFIAAPLFVMYLAAVTRFLIFSLVNLINMILAEPHQFLSGLGEILRTIELVILIGVVILIWLVMVYYNEKENISPKKAKN